MRKQIQKRKKTAWKKKAALLLLLIVLAVSFVGCGNPLKLPESVIAEPSKIYDANGKLITTLSRQNQIQVPLDQIPVYLQKATIAIEDDKFYKHHGIDLSGIGRALIRDIQAGKIVEGGSTITQQLVKNLYLSQERTFARKLKELYLTFALERKYTKKEILEAYLNRIYYGQGAYGVEVASQTYFGKPAKELKLAECAMLAGLPSLPNKLNPYVNFSGAKERQEVVLDRMSKLGMITPEESREAKTYPLKLKSGKIPTGNAPYFTQEIVRLITEKYDNGAAMLYNNGLSIYTTLDLNMQSAAEKAFAEGLKYSDPELQGALVALDPKTGFVKAYVGGRDYATSKFNRVNTHRQPGSAFKPFVYTAAIDKGFTAAKTYECEPVEFPQTDGTIYAPADYEASKYHYRPFTLKEALMVSDNIVSVKLNRDLGPEAGAQYARKMGIKSSLRPYLSLVLGTSEVTPLEMASAYGTLANGGIRTEPVFITKIVDRNGNTIEENKPKSTFAIDPKVAYIVTDMLRGVTGPGGTAGKVSLITRRPTAGKTGTTEKYADAWFVGYTPNLVASVYIGFDNPSRPVGFTGGGLGAPIWANFIEGALKNMAPVDFTQPTGIVKAKICPESGLLAPDGTDNIEMAFIEGTEPTEYCTMHGYVRPYTQDDNTLPKKGRSWNIFNRLFR